MDSYWRKNRSTVKTRENGLCQICGMYQIKGETEIHGILKEIVWSVFEEFAFLCKFTRPVSRIFDRFQLKINFILNPWNRSNVRTDEQTDKFIISKNYWSWSKIFLLIKQLTVIKTSIWVCEIIRTHISDRKTDGIV